MSGYLNQGIGTDNMPTKTKKKSNPKNRSITFLIITTVIVPVIGIKIFLNLNKQTGTNFSAVSGLTQQQEFNEIKSLADTLSLNYGCAQWTGNWTLSSTVNGGLAFPIKWKPGGNPCVILDKIILPVNLPIKVVRILFQKEYNSLIVFDWMSRNFNEIKDLPDQEVNTMGDGLAFLLLPKSDQLLLGVSYPDTIEDNLAWHWNGNTTPSCTNLEVINTLSQGEKQILAGGVEANMKQKNCF